MIATCPGDEMADIGVLEAPAVRRAGSSPVPGTTDCEDLTFVIKQSVERYHKACFASFPEGSRQYLVCIAMTLAPKQSFEYYELTESGVKIGWRLTCDSNRESMYVEFRHGECCFYSGSLTLLPGDFL